MLRRPEPSVDQLPQADVVPVSIMIRIDRVLVSVMSLAQKGPPCETITEEEQTHVSKHQDARELRAACD